MRLQRVGRLNKPAYHVVVIDGRKPRDALPIEKVGAYDPIPQADGTKRVSFKPERVHYWLSVGVQPSKKVSWLLARTGLVPTEPPRPLHSTQQHVPKKIRREEADS